MGSMTLGKLFKQLELQFLQLYNGNNWTYLKINNNDHSSS